MPSGVVFSTIVRMSFSGYVDAWIFSVYFNYVFKVKSLLLRDAPTRWKPKPGKSGEFWVVMKSKSLLESKLQVCCEVRRELVIISTRPLDAT